MNLTIEGEQYKLYFNYFTHDRRKRWKSGNLWVTISGEEKTTEAVIVKMGTDEILYKASTICVMEDTYVKDYGRMLALKKLTNLLPSELKAQVWNVYNNRKKVDFKSLSNEAKVNFILNKYNRGKTTEYSDLILQEFKKDISEDEKTLHIWNLIGGLIVENQLS